MSAKTKTITLLAICTLFLSACGMNMRNHAISDKAFAPSPLTITTKSNSDFETTKNNLRAAIAKRNLTLFAEIDHGKGAKAIGQDIGNSTLFIFGTPKIGAPMMSINPQLGFDLPFKILIVENEDGTVTLTRSDIELITQAYDITGKEMLVNKVKTNLATIIAEASQP